MIVRILRSASILILLIIFLAGSTGITFSAHICGSTGEKQVVAFPEMIQKEASCCCEAATPATSTAGSAFDNGSCCKNIHGFIKADFLGFPVSSLNLEKNFLPAEAALFYSSGFPVQDNEPCRFVYLTDPSPPPGGKDLLLSIHQIKIPFSSSSVTL